MAGRLNNLALVHLAKGQPDQALALYQRALLIRQGAVAPDLLWTIHGNLMSLYAPRRPSADRSVNVALSIWHGKQAINALQSVRAGLQDVDGDAEQSLLKSKHHYYTRLADLLVQEGRIPEAEQVLAMLKERELSDLLQRSELRKTQADEIGVERRISRENAEYAERGARYSSELAALERKARLEPLTAQETTRKDELLKSAQAWRSEYQRWLAGLTTVFAQSGRNREQTVEASSKLQTRVRAEAGAVGLHYIVSDERIAIIVATARGTFGRFSEVKRQDLYRQVAALRQAIDTRTDPLPAAQALYKTLITPVVRDLEEAQAHTLVLALTDTLRYVPFAALHDGSSFLIERHPLALYASAGGGEPGTSSTPWQVAALGLTQSRLGFNALPAVKGELEGIVRTDASPQGVLPGRISLDGAFDKAQLEEALRGRYSVVHVASHFSFTPGDESRSVLLPGAGEPISLGYLAELDFRQVQQLTLSACETATGGGANENGAEVEGLAAAVQAQGAQAVLASLWKVADASTAQLMQRFYAQRVQGQTITRAIALQQAQLALIKGAAKEDAKTPSAERSARRDGPAGSVTTTAPVDPSRPYAHPFYWAPFVLSGNWL
jgi:CHAT domain-containing protein